MEVTENDINVLANVVVINGIKTGLSTQKFDVFCGFETCLDVGILEIWVWVSKPVNVREPFDDFVHVTCLKESRKVIL